MSVHISHHVIEVMAAALAAPRNERDITRTAAMLRKQSPGSAVTALRHLLDHEKDDFRLAALQALIIEITEEADGRGADPSSPQAFIMMGAVGAFVRELQGPDAAPEAIHQYGALVFQAVHFTTAECPLYVLSTHASRYLVDGVPMGDPVAPSPAGYLQLPQHLQQMNSNIHSYHQSH